MIGALEKLAFYFEAVGVASVLAWMLAAALSLLFILGLRRSKICWTALILAIAGLVFAWINSHNISRIEIDRSEELAASRQRVAQLADKDELATESHMSQESEKAKWAEAGREEGKQDDGTPAYRKGGIVDREEGMKDRDYVPPVGPAGGGPSLAKKVRTMKDHEFAHADRLANLNLFCARWTLYLAVLLVVVDYFRRLSKTFGSFLPLPLGGPLVDSLFPKSHAVVARGNAPQWKRFLQQTVRKGETFIYFSNHDPWPAPYLRRLPSLIPLPWRLEKLTRHVDDDLNDEFLLESAWFGRYCFVLLGEGPHALRRLGALADFLELRRQTRASATHTVSVLWDLGTPIPTELLDRLLPLCRQANFRLILATAQPPSKELAARFEDVVV